MTDATQTTQGWASFARRLRDDKSGLAMVEFAVSLPFFVTIAIGGTETANYAATIMQTNQIALHIADNAARIGSEGVLVDQRLRVTEVEINDVFTGARHEGNGLVFDGFHPYTDPGTNQVVARGNARIFLSSLEPVANPNPTNRFRIRWQRCSGPGTHYTPLYGTVANSQNIAGMGPTGRQITAPEYGGVMFAEIHYHFKPLLDLGFSNLVERDIVATGTMVVRDSRNFDGPDGSGVYPTVGVAASSCT